MDALHLSGFDVAVRCPAASDTKHTVRSDMSGSSCQIEMHLYESDLNFFTSHLRIFNVVFFATQTSLNKCVDLPKNVFGLVV